MTQFCADLARLGFDVLPARKEGVLLKTRPLKNASAQAPELELRFRAESGH